MKEFGWLPEQRRKIWDERIKPALDEVVICKDELKTCKLLGLAEDAKDFYYIYAFLHVGVVMSPCSGGYVRIIDIEDYDREIRIFDLNFKFDGAEEASLRAKSDFNIFLKEEELP